MIMNVLSQRFKIILTGCLWAVLTHAVAAQSFGPVEIDPPKTDIVLGSAPEEVFMKCPQIGERLQYQWSIDGPGTLEGDLTSPAIFFRPPTILEKKLMLTTLMVTVTDEQGAQTCHQVQLTLLDPTNQKTQQDFDLTLSLNKPRYQIGDTMVITVQSAQNCYIWLFHQDAQGIITPLFPNKLQTDNYIQRDHPFIFPDPQLKNYKIRITEPTGIEHVLVIGRIAEDSGENGAWRKGIELIDLPKELSEAVVQYEVMQ